ncbi:MAG: aminoacyl-tRNA hydrolase [Humidesulfovibrio sp.]|jgi:PTH1 family peptidyl-tRNA hydrolase|uniref:aminoacyl-tRNA hydrolase n=1 Tax=Humidesulfovibrio sp. TaxID=2910988 RepID=UPI0027365FB0|nr:aminoacyl-tRNA hydrolase [Humidesulfovibrio sp.]MDP2847900.1 aminoacyl-tRNA hydrolase [Humidesulfovibrio sp.]
MDTTPLIIALGNPGPQYERTRHNFGFLVADAILTQASGRKSMALKTLQASGDFELYSLTLGGTSCLLTKPQTYMNLSGRAVARILGRYGASAANMVVLHDELDLPLGRMKLKRGGGSNGHRGIESIVEHTGSCDFLRLRLGIGRPQYSADVAKFVLEPFDETEFLAVNDIRQAALKGLTLLFRRGQAEAVQMLNAFRLAEPPTPPETMDTPGAMG